MAKNKESTESKKVEKSEKKSKSVAFSKKQLLKSHKYSVHRDALSALLNDDKAYTHDQVEKALDTFYKGGGK